MQPLWSQLGVKKYSVKDEDDEDDAKCFEPSEERDFGATGEYKFVSVASARAFCNSN